MKVCEVCGGLQTASDTDKRMVMHVEGKLHTGFAKIRKVLAELKQKRDEYRRESDRRGGNRSRSRSMSPNGRNNARKGGSSNQNQSNGQEKVEEFFYYSSKRLGSGLNCPETTGIRFSDYALQINSASGENVVLQSIEKLGKEWGYYKRNIDKQRREQ
jgi:LUC7 N_terminus